MSDNEYCVTCKQEHGPLYICEHYSEEKKKQIKEASDLFRNYLQDPKWIKEQKKHGTSDAAIATFRIFAGIDHEI